MTFPALTLRVSQLEARSLVLLPLAGPANGDSREAKPPFGRLRVAARQTSPLFRGGLSAGVQRNPTASKSTTASISRFDLKQTTRVLEYT